MRGSASKTKDNLLKTKELDTKQEEAIKSLRDRVAQMKSKIEGVGVLHSPAVNA